jgi:hypothetical protein
MSLFSPARAAAVVVFALLATVLLPACSNPQRPGATKGQLRTVIPIAAEEIIQTHAAQRGTEGPRPLVAFAGVENRSQWALGATSEAAYEEVETRFVNSGLFRMISGRQVDEARRASGLTRVSQLFLPEFREPYMRVLGDMGLTPDYLMWGVFTSLDDQTGARGVGSDYRFTLEVINAQTGETVYKSTAESVR